MTWTRSAGLEESPTGATGTDADTNFRAASRAIAKVGIARGGLVDAAIGLTAAKKDAEPTALFGGLAVTTLGGLIRFSCDPFHPVSFDRLGAGS